METFGYPGSAQILAARGITLTRGDGGITLTDCGKAGSFQIKVRAITTPPNPNDEVCFAAPGASGYLALSIPNAYRVSTYGRSVRASLSTDHKPTETVDVAAGGDKGIGETLDPNSRAVVLELRVTGSTAPAPAPQPTDPALAFAAKVNVGDGKRSCTGTLVDRYWLMTAASCFTDTPNDLSTVTAGPPKDRTTVTVGRTDLTNTGTGAVVDVAELVPRTDRDLVMARLVSPVNGITPATVGTTAPAAAENLRVAGYGRTASDWVPTKIHTTTHTVGAAATTIDTAPADGQAPICQGDAGAPLLRDKNGTTEIAAIASRSWQGGCLDTPATETRTGATSTRTDDITGWIQQVRDAYWTAATSNPAARSSVYDPVRKIATVFAVDANGHLVYRSSDDGKTWNSWLQIGDRQFASTPTALFNPATGAIELFVIGRDGKPCHTSYMADAQGWRGWEKLSDTTFTGNPTAVYNPVTKTAEVFATTTGGPVAHSYYTAGSSPNGWSPFTTINTRTFNATPSAVYNPATGTIELFAVGRDDATMYHAYWSPDGKPWSDWFPIYGGTVTGSPSVVYNPSNQTAQVFATSTNGPIVHSYYKPGMGPWSTWAPINGKAFSGSPTAVYNPATGTVELFAVGRDDATMYHAYWSPDGTPWSPWYGLGNWKFSSGRLATATYSPFSDRVDLFATGTDGAMNHTSYAPTFTSWASWETLPGATLLTS
ncbi:trypsin-like serine protease [Kitasatospora sp. NPDC089509]|uniref:trypsin-like serine protease n=1 Tax=Kitasatospora sp. NPDC089509 TaxID=3364079 RepID=UPI00382CED2D